MSSAVATIQNGTQAPGIMFDVIAKGDLSKLTDDQKARYYVETCTSLGINPLTKPFEYLTLNGKTVLYATRTAADQLRQINGVSVVSIGRETIDGVHIVTVRVRDKAGREDEEIGAVNVKGLEGEPLANAYMKATTKAKRRATLSLCGLGWLDETEVETIPGAQRIAGPEIVVTDAGPVDTATGEIIEPEDIPQDEVGDYDGSLRLRSAIDGAGSMADLNRVADEIKAAVKENALTGQEANDLLGAVTTKRAALRLISGN